MLNILSDLEVKVMNLENFHVKVFLKLFISGTFRQNYMILTHMRIYLYIYIYLIDYLVYWLQIFGISFKVTRCFTSK